MRILAMDFSYGVKVDFCIPRGYNSSLTAYDNAEQIIRWSQAKSCVKE